MAKKILFLIPYPLKKSPSQRFRFEQYFNILSEKGFHYEVQSFLDAGQWKIFFYSGNGIAKNVVLLKGLLKRFFVLFRCLSYDFIFIHREIAPVGPPILEWLIAKVLHRRIIYDFDDAIWMTDRKNENWIMKAIKWRSKVGSICRWSHKVSCGNLFLASYASTFNSHSLINPTTIEVSRYHKPFPSADFKKKEICIGWTGSHSTLKYLTEIESVLAVIEKKFDHVHFLIIADRDPELLISRLRFVPWNENSEVKDLQQIDIGIMPLPDEQWSKGKCGLKILQYMALGIPAVASRVGVNAQIITTGQNGFLCETEDEWIYALESLVQNEPLRNTLGSEGRKTIYDRYSVESNSDNFLSLFQ